MDSKDAMKVIGEIDMKLARINSLVKDTLPKMKGFIEADLKDRGLKVDVGKVPWYIGYETSDWIAEISYDGDRGIAILMDSGTEYYWDYIPNTWKMDVYGCYMDNTYNESPSGY